MHTTVLVACRADVLVTAYAASHKSHHAEHQLCTNKTD